MNATGSVELLSVICKSSIVGAIWGPTGDDKNDQARIEHLSSFFTYVERERDFEQLPYDVILFTFGILKAAPGKPKSQLREENERVSIASGASSKAPVFDLAVRCMLVTACSQPGAMNMGGGSIFRPRWKESETLETYLHRVFPICRAPQQDLASFRLGKLCARYLRSFASVDIKWTDNLSDHLILLRGETWKSLYVFRHPGFLKASLDTLGADDEDMTHTPLQALKLGCLPPGLLKETLMTLDIVFPVVGDNASRSILEREVQKHNLDNYFLDRFYLDARDHERPADALEPSDVRSLYDKYPYWADRLYELWREADDPTPVTGIERWTEARRNPRFTYWCAVISILIAILFGMVATGLAAAQVWISWCDWLDDPSLAQCGYKKRGDTEKL
ncbi:hypothetical protein F4778DRAFT_511001 [Xylariomycetidae sp. FL2044]|nr:hypothetical protein F4778DRAFT_511001 [Xylariomycetidae sp. FL2044]